MAYLGKTMQFLLHLGAPEINFSRAKRLRNSMTEAERILWSRIRNNRLNGYKFRRQHPIGQYIADFYCHGKRLIVEVDGMIHNQSQASENDENRTAELERFGIKVIRVTNEEIIEDIDKVLNNILNELGKPSYPSP